MNKTSAPSMKELRLVKKIHQKLSRKTQKAYDQNIISKNNLNQYTQELSNIKKSYLKDLQAKQVFSPQSLKPVYENLQASLPKTLTDNKNVILHEQVKLENETSIPQPQTKYYFQFKQLKDHPTPLTKKQLSLAEKISQKALDHHAHEALELGMIDWALSLPSQLDELEKACNQDPQQMKEAISSLGRIAGLFFKNSFLVPESEKIHPKRLYVLAKLVHVQMFLAKQIEPKWKASANILPTPTNYSANFFNFGDFQLEKNYALLQDARFEDNLDDNFDDKKIEINKNYLSDSSQPIGENAYISFKEKLEDDQQNMASLFSDIAPDIIKKLSLTHPHFSKLPPYQQNARIYASKDLPDWITAIRDTHLAFTYLKEESVANPLNPKAQLNFEFHIQDGKDKSLVWISVNGIDGKLQELYPNIKKIRENPQARFAGMYRPFSSAQNEALFKAMQTYFFPTEKKILCDQAALHHLNMPDEDFKEFMYIISSGQMRRQDILAFFQRHPDKFKDLDYQIFFKILFFDQNTLSLIHDMQSCNTLSSNLATFIEKSYQHYLDQNEIQTCVFLLQMAHQFSSYSPEQDFYKNSLKELRQLLSKQALEPEEKSVIYAELIAQLASKKELSKREVKELLIGTIYLRQNPVLSKWTDPETNRMIRDGMIIHSESISKALKNDQGANQTLLNQILKTGFPSAKQQKWMIHQVGDHEEFISKNGQYRYAPLSRQIQAKNKKIPLPSQIREHAYFRKFFSTIRQGVPCADNIYRFVDSQGIETLVKLIDEQLVIEQKRDGKWLKFLPADQFFEKDEEGVVNSSLSSRHLVHHFTHWMDPADLTRVLIVDPVNHKTTYEAKLKGEQLIEIRRLKDGARLGKTSDLLDHFEDPAYVHQWFDDAGNVTEIELPRFDLNFTFDPIHQRFMCKQKKGYFLDLNAREESLGVFKHYMILKNDTGRELVLVPKQKFQSELKKEVLEPRYKINTQLALEDREKQSVLTYEINAKKQFVNPSTEANLYLAQVLALVQEYETSATILIKSGTKLSPYTAAEKEILEDFIALDQITGDQSGNGLALRTFAGYCLLSNSINYQKEPSKKTLKLISENYEKYLQHLSHATAIQLEKAQEIFLLKILLDHQFDPLMFVRLKQLDPKYAQTLTFKEQKDLPTSNKVINPFIELDLKLNKTSDYRNEENPLLTRPGKVISKHFSYFFSLALNGTKEEKQNLSHYLPFLKLENSGKYLGLAILLETALHHPHHFSLPPHDKGNFIRWQNKTWNEAYQLYKKKSSFKIEQKELIIPKQKIAQTPKEMVGKKLNQQKKAFVLNLTAVPLFSQESEKYFIKVPKDQKASLSVRKMKRIAKSNVQKLSKGGDPLEKTEWKRLSKDLKSYASQQKSFSYVPKDKNSLQELQKDVKAKKIEIDFLLQAQEVDILAIANRKPSSRVKRDLRKLALWGNNRKVLSLEDLILYFGRQDAQAIRQANPALSDEDVNTLMSLVGDYLLQATLGQQLERSEVILNEMLQLTNKETKKFKNLSQKLAIALPEADRQYDPAQRPAYLVFEYAANILMFPQQTKILEEFLNGGKANSVMEMIMGSGKSKVLLPLLGLLRADGKNLSMLIVPEPLFEDTASNTQKMLEESFAQKLKTLHFDRSTTFSSLRLQTILDELLTIQKERQCLIMTSKSEKCLKLKFIEKCDEYFKLKDPSKPFPDELILMQKILQVLSSSGYPIIDEADTLLNILHETSFSLGEGRPPNKDEVQLISELYQLVYSDPTLKKMAKIESDPASDPKAPPLTEKLFFDKYQRHLAVKFLDHLGSIEFETKTLNQKISPFIQSLGPHQKNLVLDYLCGKEENVKELQAYYDSLDPAIQNLLALASKELSHFLPHTLLKNSDEKYGLDEMKGGIIAIPFSSVKTPAHGSQFANAFITMNYTFQIYAKKGIGRDVIENEIKRLQGQAMKELKENSHQKLEDTEAWKLFSSFRDKSKMPLFNYKEQEIDTFVASLNHDLKRKQIFIQRIILPQLVLHDEKLSFNPLHSVGFSDQVIGFTGTLWNSKSMQRKLQAQPAEGTDSKTLCLLQKHSSGPVITLIGNTTEELLKNIHKQGIQFDLLADSGGYCRDWDNERIAEYLSKKWNEPVVYYSKAGAGQQYETYKGHKTLFSESKTSADQRKTFLDQSHTTGADVPQALNAIGLVTIGENMLFRDLLQSVWRLRGLDKGQRVQFVVNEKVKAIINQELGKKAGEDITYTDILQFTIRNQAKRQGKDNFTALKKELKSISQMLVLNVLMRSDISIKRQRRLYRHLRSVWIESTAKTPRELFGKIAVKRKRKAVVEEELTLCVAGLESIFAKFPWLEEKGFKKDRLLKDAESIVQRMGNSLPRQIVSSEMEDDNTVETEAETEKETELEVESQFEDPKKNLGYHNGFGLGRINKLEDEIFNNLYQPSFSLKLYLEKDASLKSYANAFKGIDLALNVLQWPEKEPKVENLQFFGPNRTPLQYVHLDENGTVNLLNQQKNNPYDLNLYHLTNGILNKEKAHLLTLKTLKKIVKIKFLNGDFDYSKQELDLLRDWLGQEGAAKMKKLYHEHILLGFPQKAIRYQGSSLDHLFKELIT